MSEQISWPELVTLMAFGNGPEPSVSGTVHLRAVHEADAPSSESHRVVKHGELVRRERLDGRPLAIFGRDRKWIWLNDDELPTEFANAAWGWSDYAVVERHPLSRWEGTDFTRPTGPVTPTELLGRPAWAVELAPPAHKPYPLTLVVDAETGIVLQERNDGFGSVVEWTEILFGAQLPDELFEWDGDVLAPPDHAAQHEREMATRREWLAAHGVGLPTLAVTPKLDLHTWDDDTGAFEASMYWQLSTSVLRRPRSESDWETNTNWPHNYRWTDADFDWFVGSAAELSPAQVDSLRTQLADG